MAVVIILASADRTACFAYLTVELEKHRRGDWDPRAVGARPTRSRSSGRAARPALRDVATCRSDTSGAACNGGARATARRMPVPMLVLYEVPPLNIGMRCDAALRRVASRCVAWYCAVRYVTVSVTTRGRMHTSSAEVGSSQARGRAAARRRAGRYGQSAY